MTGALAKLTGAVGMKKLQADLQVVSDDAYALATEFWNSGNEAEVALDKAATGLEETSKNIDRLRKSAHTVIDVVVRTTKEEVKTSKPGGDRKGGRTEAEILAEDLPKAFNQWSRYYDRKADLDEKDIKRMEDHVAKIEEIQATAIGTIGDAATEMATSIIDGSESAGKAMAKAMIKAAQAIVMAYASAAAADAFYENSKVPVIGIALGTAAAAAAFGIVSALVDRIPSAEQGMLVRGGTANRDSVLINAMAGERLLTKEQTRIYDQGGRGGGLNLTVVAPQSSMFPNQAEAQRYLVQQVAPALVRALKDGQIRIPRSALEG
jgi:hypothetical protein